jgi:hypothetical protein
MDRSIVIRQKRRAPDEQIEAFRHRLVAPEGDQLRHRIEAYAQRRRDALMSANPEMPDGLSDRPADVWEALLAIGDDAGGEWPSQLRHAALKLSVARTDESPTRGMQVLADCRTVFCDGDKTHLGSADLTSRLLLLEDSPWGDHNGKPLDQRRLAALLKPYGIKPHTIRFGNQTLRGYDRVDFADSWKRYLPSLSTESATRATTHPGQA